MATAVVMPKLGNSVESSIIVGWKKKKGDRVAEREPLFEVETDKATLEVESPASGVLLDIFFKDGDDVPVMTTIAAIGEPGENVEALRPASATSSPATTPAGPSIQRSPAAASPATNGQSAPRQIIATQESHQENGISPRARNLAVSKDLDVTDIQGTGPGG